MREAGLFWLDPNDNISGRKIRKPLSASAHRQVMLMGVALGCTGLHVAALPVAEDFLP